MEMLVVQVLILLNTIKFFMVKLLMGIGWGVGEASKGSLGIVVPLTILSALLFFNNNQF